MFLNRNSVGITTDDGIGILYLLVQIVVLRTDNQIVRLKDTIQ